MVLMICNVLSVLVICFGLYVVVDVVSEILKDLRK